MTSKNAKFLALFVCLGGAVMLAWTVKGKVTGGVSNDGWRPSAAELAQVTPEGEREYQEIQIGDKSLRVEVADTNQKIKTGLSYRSEIGSDGMLFVMGYRERPSFWMKGMLFSLDLVWIGCGGNIKYQISKIKNEDCVVAEVTENVPVEVDPEQPVNYYSPKVPVTHVLEVPEGWVEENEVKVGDVVKIGD